MEANKSMTVQGLERMRALMRHWTGLLHRALQYSGSDTKETKKQISGLNKCLSSYNVSGF